MGLPRRSRDGWLFLTPEIEREVPGLIERVAAGAGERRPVAAEEAAIDALVRDGDARAWMAYVRDLRVLLERAVAAGADPPACERLALILLEQHLLAPGVRDPAAEAPGEEERLRALIA